MNTTERVRRVIAEQLGMDLENVTPEKTFAEDLRADSLDRIELTLTGMSAKRKSGVMSTG